MPDTTSQPFASLRTTASTEGSRTTHKLGIVGGGQLARMLAQSAIQLGCEVVILERKPECPAASLACKVIEGDWDEPEQLLKLGEIAGVITLENEFVDAGSLAELEAAGHALWPTAETIRLVQDKLLQKQALVAAGLPVADFMAVADRAAVEKAGAKFGWPLVLKKRRNGYDGKGNFTLDSAADIEEAWSQLGGDKNELYVEKFFPFALELAVMVVRSQNGEEISYPVVETIQRDHICHVVKAPVAVTPAIEAKAAEVARAAVAAVKCVGAMGVEMFLGRDGALVINELAPRVHNSGHYTIEACVCSQFENHVRAVMGWPLGSPAMRASAAVMVNLLGAGKGTGAPHGLNHALQVAGAHIHVYGKAVSAPGRKMGHVTALGRTVDEALATAQRAAGAIRFGD